MCGICGIVAGGTGVPSLSAERCLAMRDALRHRGPDGEGEWRGPHGWLGHRRLAIIDPHNGRQPMVRGEGDHQTIVVFNGELLNHLEIRRQLETEGAQFHTDCDAETVAEAVHRWGEAAIERFRGLFAVAWYQPGTRRLVLARDPLGVVPLHYAEPTGEFVFASEPVALLKHPGVDATPDPVVVSAYLSTIRITLGSRTMFRGISTLEPGTLLRVDLSNERPRTSVHRWWHTPERGERRDPDGSGFRAVFAASVEAHLLSDVEVCGLLSGGIDSASIVTEARHRVPNLRTFCAVGGDGREDPDPPAARMVADHLGTEHHEVVLKEDARSRWQRMVAAQRLPLGTPNEVAINALAEGIRNAGVKVALSGEGADEILGGYELVAALALDRYAVQGPPRDHRDAAGWLLDSISFIAPARKASLMQPAFLAEAEHDEHLQSNVAEALAVAGPLDDPGCVLGYYLHRNLPGLLGRLNSAMMLASVEARPPFADREVVDFAAGLHRTELFDRDAEGVTRTKRILRSAFASDLPSEILQRPKASFPVPYLEWLDPVFADRDLVGRLESIVRPEVLAEVVRQPTQHPLVAWPLANLGLWLGGLAAEDAETGLNG